MIDVHIGTAGKCHLRSCLEENEMEMPHLPNSTFTLRLSFLLYGLSENGVDNLPPSHSSSHQFTCSLCLKALMHQSNCRPSPLFGCQWASVTLILSQAVGSCQSLSPVQPIQHVKSAVEPLIKKERYDWLFPLQKYNPGSWCFLKLANDWTGKFFQHVKLNRKEWGKQSFSNRLSTQFLQPVTVVSMDSPSSLIFSSASSFHLPKPKDQGLTTPLSVANIYQTYFQLEADILQNHLSGGREWCESSRRQLLSHNNSLYISIRWSFSFLSQWQMAHLHLLVRRVISYASEEHTC